MCVRCKYCRSSDMSIFKNMLRRRIPLESILDNLVKNIFYDVASEHVYVGALLNYRSSAIAISTHTSGRACPISQLLTFEICILLVYFVYVAPQVFLACALHCNANYIVRTDGSHKSNLEYFLHTSLKYDMLIHNCVSR